MLNRHSRIWKDAHSGNPGLIGSVAGVRCEEFTNSAYIVLENTETLRVQHCCTTVVASS